MSTKNVSTKKLQLDVPTEIHQELVKVQAQLAINGKRASLATVAVSAIKEGVVLVTQ